MDASEQPFGMIEQFGLPENTAQEYPPASKKSVEFSTITVWLGLLKATIHLR